MKLRRRELLQAAAASTVALGLPSLSRAGEAEVGGVADIVNVAWSTNAPEPREEIEFEDAVYMNEVVETDDESAVEIKFSDGSKLTVGENARIVIDTYVYNPTVGSGQQAITLAKGAFRFLSGAIPKENVSLKTPTVTIGIRGTELMFDVAEDGETELSTLAGEAECTDGEGTRLTVAVEQSVLVDRTRRFRGGVRRFRHKTRSIVIAEGFEGARKRWRIRKQKKRRAVRRRRLRRND